MTWTDLRKLCVFAALVAGPAVAGAQEGHPRRARAMAVMGESAAVWLEDDRGWIPSTGFEPVSLCVGRCRPIVERRACDVPECPGPGTLLVTGVPLGSVDDFPEDVEGFEEELEAMRGDAVLGTVAGAFGVHPDHDRDEDDGGGAQWTLSLGGTIASRSRGAALFGGIGATGLVYRLDTDETYADPEGDGAFFASVVGDRLGIEARVRVFRERGAQELTYSVGGALVLENRVAGSMWQVPSLIGFFVPELGVFVRGGQRSFYAGFGVPVKVFATRGLGVQLRPEVLFVSDFEGEDSSALLSLSIQGALQ